MTSNSAARRVARATACSLMLLAATAGARAGTLEDVKARGKLVCGVSEGLGGFSEKDETGAWRGFDVDFCKAVALAITGDATKVDYVPLSATDRFKALADGKIDLLSRNSTWTFSRDAGQNLEFVGVSYFDGQGFMVPSIYGATSPLQLNGATICVLDETTTQDNAAAYFARAGLKVSFLPFAERQDARKAYADGQCDAYTADRSALAAERADLPKPEDHTILKDVISKEPLGPVVRDDDPKWVNLVRWVLFGLIDGEETGLTSTSVAGDKAQEAARLGALTGPTLGLSDDWLAKVIGGVGNSGEIFERNLGEETPMQLSRGINALWTQGGILYAPPMQ
ncbi:amino acid ABC transporter substrate-binding protein [Kaistia sp. 32K]|uniref:amino acid ABC transporter substrate-binding protein n=1 Tax=Kaistia sp. 32K TaxID=2795690 RepID=UPI00193513AD|nr:amino acid ABC transporter substrate-binding protein [Kaistia sp. 32K]BCP54232.1 amino acid ABC transporter substrate-binding protein [Kaistia sp. 32K]